MERGQRKTKLYQISSIRNQENKWWNKLKFRKKFKLLSPLSLLLFNIMNQENKRWDLVNFFQMIVRLSLPARVSLKAYNKKFRKKFKLLSPLSLLLFNIMNQENKRWDLVNFFQMIVRLSLPARVSLTFYQTDK